MSDGLDLQQIIASQFDLGAHGHTDPEAVTERTFWARYKRLLTKRKWAPRVRHPWTPRRRVPLSALNCRCFFPN
jgi:hypothetical protein